MSFSRHRRNYHPWTEHNYFYSDNELVEMEAEVDSYSVEREVMDIKPDDIPDPIACAEEYNPYLNYNTQDQPIEIKQEIKEEPPDDNPQNTEGVSLEELATQLQELVMRSGNESSTVLTRQVEEPITQSNPGDQSINSNIVHVVNQQKNDQRMKPNCKKVPVSGVVSASTKEVSDAVSAFDIVVEPGSYSQFAVYMDPKEGGDVGKVLLFSVKALPTDNSTDKESFASSNNSGGSVPAALQENQSKTSHQMPDMLKSSSTIRENTSEILTQAKFDTSDSSNTNTQNTTKSDKEISVINCSKPINDGSSTSPESADSCASNSIKNDTLKSHESVNIRDLIHTSRFIGRYPVKLPKSSNKLYTNRILKSVGSNCAKSLKFAKNRNLNHSSQSVTRSNIKHSPSTNNTDIIQTPKSVNTTGLLNDSKPLCGGNTSRNSESVFLHSVESTGTVTVSGSQFSKKVLWKPSVGENMKDSKNLRVHSATRNPNSILKSSQKRGPQSLSPLSLVKQKAQSPHTISTEQVSRNREATESPIDCKKETRGTEEKADSTTTDVTSLDHTYSVSYTTEASRVVLPNSSSGTVSGDSKSRVRNYPWPTSTDTDGAPVQKKLRLMDDSYRLDRMYGHMKQLQLELAMMDLERAKLDLELTRLQAQREREIAGLRLRNARELVRMEADWCLIPDGVDLWD